MYKVCFTYFFYSRFKKQCPFIIKNVNETIVYSVFLYNFLILEVLILQRSLKRHFKLYIDNVNKTIFDDIFLYNLRLQIEFS